jgi:hypothetical protein
MAFDDFRRFRSQHDQDKRCSAAGWDFIETMWRQSLSDLGGRVDVHDEGSAHLDWYYENGEQEFLAWMLYPGGGTGGDRPRFEVHFDSARKRLPADESSARLTAVADELRKVVSWRPWIKPENVRRWHLPLEGLGAEHASQCALEALATLTR